jgi:DNA mismatch endonuclease (patch repair protein)
MTRKPLRPEGGRARAPSFDDLLPASEAASRAKRSNRKKDTMPEMLLRRAVWRLGLRYRKHSAGLPGNPDLVFRAARVVVFCDGDFWHGRDWERLRADLRRRHNAEYWIAKIGRNRERDEEQNARLTGGGWLVVRLWESEIVRDPEGVARRVAHIVRGRMSGAPVGERASD